MAIAYQRAAGATGTSVTLDIGTAGNDRLVVITTGNEGTGNALIGVTVDGKACTKITRADNADGAGNETEMWYIMESGLGASNGSVTVSVTGGDAGFAVHALLFYGVPDQVPIDNEIDDTSVGTDTTVVDNITTTNDDVVIFIACHGLTAGLSSWTSPIVTTIDGDTETANPSSAKMWTGYGIETTGQINKTYIATWAATHNRSSGIAVVWADAAAGGSLLKIINETQQISDSNQRNITFNRIINETENITENNQRNITLTRIINESVNIIEGILKFIGFVKIINETINITESVLKFTGIVKIINETIAISENVVKKITEVIGEIVLSILRKFKQDIEVRKFYFDTEVRKFKLDNEVRLFYVN